MKGIWLDLVDYGPARRAHAALPLAIALLIPAGVCAQSYPRGTKQPLVEALKGASQQWVIRCTSPNSGAALWSALSCTMSPAGGGSSVYSALSWTKDQAGDDQAMTDMVPSAPAQMKWKDFEAMCDALKPAVSSLRGTIDDAPCTPQKDRAYLMHVVEWTAAADSASVSATSSIWFAFHLTGGSGNETLVLDRNDGNGQPILDGEKDALVVGIHLMGGPLLPADAAKEFSAAPWKQVQISYTAAATTGTAENQNALTSIVGAVTGIQVSSNGAGPAGGASGTSRGASPSVEVYRPALVAANLVSGADLPFSLAITAEASMVTSAAEGDGGGRGAVNSLGTAPVMISPAAFRFAPQRQGGGGGGQQSGTGAQGSAESTPASSSPNSAAVDCSQVTASSPCQLPFTFQSSDREWWDVGIGVFSTGLREPSYSVPSSGTVIAVSNSTTQPIYVLGMIGYDLHHLSDNKFLWALPHFDFGIPATGSASHRLLLAGGYQLNFAWIQKHLVPFGFFAGAVPDRYLSLDALAIGETATSAQLAGDLRLRTHLKGIIGLEFSATEMISKIKSGS